MITAVLHRLIVLVGLTAASLPGIERCAIIAASDVIVIAKLEGAEAPVERRSFLFSGRLHISEVVKGERPNEEPIEYVFLCKGCQQMDRPRAYRALRFVTAEGIWFLRRNGEIWTSAFPQSGDPGYRALDQFDSYTECMERRRNARR